MKILKKLVFLVVMTMSFIGCYWWSGAFNTANNVTPVGTQNINISFVQNNFFTMRVCMRSGLYSWQDRNDPQPTQHTEEISIPYYYCYNPDVATQAQNQDTVIEENTLYLDGYNANQSLNSGGVAIYMTNVPYVSDPNLYHYYTDNSTLYYNPINNLWFGYWRIVNVTKGNTVNQMLVMKFKVPGLKKQYVRWAFINTYIGGHQALKLESVSSPKIDKDNEFVGENQILIDSILDYSNMHTLPFLTNSTGLNFYQHDQYWKSNQRVKAVEKFALSHTNLIGGIQLYNQQDAYLVCSTFKYRYRHATTFVGPSEFNVVEAQKIFSSE